jgi:carboxyl-terminal processing protease
MKKLLPGLLVLIFLIFSTACFQAFFADKNQAGLQNKLPANASASTKAGPREDAEGMEAGFMLAKLIDKYHFISDTEQYDQDKNTRLLKSMLETWDPDKIFIVKTDKPFLSHLLDLLEEQTVPVEIDFRLAELLQEFISQRQQLIKSFLLSYFDDEFQADSEERISALRINDQYCATSMELQQRWNGLARYQVIKEYILLQKVNPAATTEMNAAANVDLLKRSMEKAKKKLLAQVDRKSISRHNLRARYLFAYAHSYDPYTAYEPSEDKTARLSSVGKKCDFGIEMIKTGSEVQVASVIPASPAQEAGVQTGDILVTVTAKGSQLDDLDELDDNAAFTLSDLFPGQESLNLTFRRGKVSTDIPLSKRPINSAKGRLYAQEYDNKSILYLRIPSFYSKDAEIDAALSLADTARGAILSWKNDSSIKQRGLILDLRNNSGGNLPAALEMAGAFLSNKEILKSLTRSQTIVSYKSDQAKSCFDGKIVVMVDEETASSAEILAAALQDHNSAIIVGARTYGKGHQQFLVDMHATPPRAEQEKTENGAQEELSGAAKDLGTARITAAQLYRHSGIPLHRLGIEPDIEIRRPVEKLRTPVTMPTMFASTGRLPAQYLQQYVPRRQLSSRMKERSAKRQQQNRKFVEREQLAQEYQQFFDNDIKLIPDEVRRYVELSEKYTKEYTPDLNTPKYDLDADVEFLESVEILKDINRTSGAATAGEENQTMQES